MAGRTKRLYAIELNSKELFSGDLRECAEYLSLSVGYVSSAAYKQIPVLEEYYIVPKGLIPRKKHSNALRYTKKQRTHLTEDTIFMRDVFKLRNRTPLGTMVNVFEDHDFGFRHDIGTFPIVDKHRYVFDIQKHGYRESFSWIELFRKDGVEVADEQ